MKMTRTISAAAFILCASLLASRSAAAQQSASSPYPLQASLRTTPEDAASSGSSASQALQRELQRLGAAAESLNHSLPSITCIETGVSESLKKRKVKKRMTFAANLRAIRTPQAGLHESYTLTRVDDKPEFKQVFFPFFSGGGIGTSLAYFLPRLQPCYVYTLSPGRIDFRTAPDVESRPTCRSEDVHGFALLDADGNVTHIERTVPQQSAQDFRLAPFAAVDLAPVNFNGQTYSLARHVVSEVYQGGLTGRFEATYSGCRLYTATVTILPATHVVPNPTTGPDSAGN